MNSRKEGYLIRFGYPFFLPWFRTKALNFRNCTSPVHPAQA